MPASLAFICRVSRLFVLGGFASTAFAGCTDATAPCEDVDGNPCVATPGETRYTGAPLSGTSAYAGKPIVIENANGTLVVTASAATAISAQATPFAFAATQPDADAALAELAIVIDDTSIPGKIHVQCTQARSDHGTAAAVNTGCGEMTVVVPAGATGTPVSLAVTAHNGDTTVSGVTGQAVVHAHLGDVTLSIAPTLGASIEASSDNGQATLTLPGDFAADRVLIEADNGTFDTNFVDISSTTTSHGTEGTGASSVVLSSKNGDIHLVSM